MEGYCGCGFEVVNYDSMYMDIVTYLIRKYNHKNKKFRPKLGRSCRSIFIL